MVARNMATKGLTEAPTKKSDVVKIIKVPQKIKILALVFLKM